MVEKSDMVEAIIYHKKKRAPPQKKARVRVPADKRHQIILAIVEAIKRGTPYDVLLRNMMLETKYSMVTARQWLNEAYFLAGVKPGEEPYDGPTITESVNQLIDRMKNPVKDIPTQEEEGEI
jgi:hypothetical protein